ncbi:DUF3306 domain-containing protein [Aromatoleum toluolicum]|uniref:DUF3306 domain-containing protein n=1 Tax=Aromatoleum toluolicum TaxID=90060 RepID=A0ABX1NCQ7_9RHOO|nr:DUF3306 domain-containing protein [Aromatoleum toluolicum]NMF97076.1 DUF3306 domain-containing protein [Aromatoleum toluolicum]
MSRFLERWSRLKRGDAAAAEPVAPVVPATPAAQGRAAPAAAPTAAPTADAGSPASPAEAALPPIDSLDLAADFSAFMKKEVSESLRRAALRKLFSDPHFHFERMDKLDIYIDDYSGSDPIPADMLQKLGQFEMLLKEEDAQESAAQPAASQAVGDADAGQSPAAATSDAQAAEGAPGAPSAGATPSRHGEASAQPGSGGPTPADRA